MDMGTDSTKAGFAGGSKPKVVIGTKIGRAKHVRVMPGGALTTDHDGVNAGDQGGSMMARASASNTGKFSKNTNSSSSVFVGKMLDDHRGAFILDYPMEKGCVVDGCWDYMEHIWNVSIKVLSAFSTLNTVIDSGM